MKKILQIVLVIVLVILINFGIVHAATVLFPSGGGTGTSTNPVYGQVLVGNVGGTYTLTATSSLGITGGGSSYPFPLTGNATSTLTQFNGGLTAYASTTIGGAGLTNGLVINGSATTTRNAYVAGNVGIGQQSPQFPLDVNGTIGNSNGNLVLNAGGSSGNLGDFLTGDSSSGVITIGNSLVGSGLTLEFDTSSGATHLNGPVLEIGSAGVQDGTLTLDAPSSGQVSITSKSGSSNWVLQLPGNGGTNGALLQTNGSGITSWVATSSLGIGGSGTVTSIATNNGLTGGTITTTGTIGLDISSLATNGLVSWNGSKLAATGTPLLTVGNLVSTTTTASSFAGALGIGSTSPFALLSVQGSSNIPQFIVKANSIQSADLFDAIKSNGTKAVIFGNQIFTNKNNIGLYDLNQAGYTVGSAGSTNYDYGGLLDIHAVDDTGFLLKLYNTTFSSTIPVFDYFGDNSGNLIQSSETGTLSLATNGYVNPRLTIDASGNTQIGFVNKSVDTGLWTVPANTLTVTQIGSVNPFAVQNSSGTNLVQVLNGGNVGIGTSTPYANLSVQSNASTGDAFVVATSTGNTVSGVDNDGHKFSSGPAPVISSCGTGTGTVVGDDQSGTITTATAATACTMTFSKAYRNVPTCIVTDNSLVGFADVSSISTGSVTFGISSALTGGNLYYSCQYHR